MWFDVETRSRELLVFHAETFQIKSLRTSFNGLCEFTLKFRQPPEASRKIISRLLDKRCLSLKKFYSSRLEQKKFVVFTARVITLIFQTPETERSITFTFDCINYLLNVLIEIKEIFLLHEF